MMTLDGELDDSEVSHSHANERAGERYRRKAAECEGRAASAADVAMRVNYRALADYWNDMARDAEAHDQIVRGPKA